MRREATAQARDEVTESLGRQIEYYKDHIVINMTKEYYNTSLKLYKIQANEKLIGNYSTNKNNYIT
eukprot:5240144-Amphidinium_carterae.1